MSEQTYPQSKQQIAHLWDQVQQVISRWRPSRLTADTPRLSEYAWNRFDCRLVLEILTSGDEFYPGLREILFAGLGIFIVCPDRHILRRHAMSRAGVEHLRDGERRGQSVFLNDPMLGDFAGRLLFVHKDFFSDFYYPVGGSSALSLSSLRRFRSTIRKRMWHLPELIQLMRIYHYHALNYGDDSVYFGKSRRSGAILASKVKTQRLSLTVTNPGNIEAIWKDQCGAAALIYAAESLSMSDGSTLLEGMVSGEAKYENVRHLLPLLVSRARYAVEVILSGMTDKKAYVTNAALIPSYKLEEIPLPNFDQQDVVTLHAKYNKKLVFGSRRQTEITRRRQG